MMHVYGHVRVSERETESISHFNETYIVVYFWLAVNGFTLVQDPLTLFITTHCHWSMTGY